METIKISKTMQQADYQADATLIAAVQAAGGLGRVGPAEWRENGGK